MLPNHGSSGRNERNPKFLCYSEILTHLSTQAAMLAASGMGTSPPIGHEHGLS